MKIKKISLIAVLLIFSVSLVGCSKKDCNKACNNYVNLCLKLFPNYTQSLLDEGLNSCMYECKNWDIKKTNCMKNSNKCEDFVDVCGL